MKNASTIAAFDTEDSLRAQSREYAQRMGSAWDVQLDATDPVREESSRGTVSPSYSLVRAHGLISFAAHVLGVPWEVYFMNLFW